MNIRFLIILLALVSLVLIALGGWSAYGYYQAIHADDPIDPTLRVEMGAGKIIRGESAIELTESESYTLESQDIVETDKESRATITWPDRSITRLGADTRIVIEKMLVSQNYDQIQISYDVKKGKVWNSVIRLLLGDSYFEAHLPKNGIVAGVRGTTFEVNLNSGYIHAVDHTTRLIDSSGKSVNLLPGELVSSENIFISLGRGVLDTAWNEWNTLSDKTYENIRSLELERRLRELRGDTGGWLSRIMKTILSYFSGFEAIDITRALDSGNREKLQKYSESTLLEYYQKVSSLSVGSTRDTLRSGIIEKIGETKEYQNMRSLLESASVWESIDTGKMLPSTEKFLKERGIDTTDFSQKFSSGMKNDTKKLLESLSGSIQGVIRF